MRYFNVTGFNNDSCAAFSKCVETAARLKCKANTAHMFYGILYISEYYRKKFESTTGVSVSKYIDIMKTSFEKDPDINEDFQGKVEDILDTDLYEFLLNIGERNRDKGTEESLAETYKELLENKNNKLFIVFDKLGIEESNFNKMTTDNILRDMKDTQKFAIDMCYIAATGKYDPISGRNREINNVIEILGRRQKNNPVLIGEPGVGKTAIIEGLAQRIINKDVPKYLQNVHIINIDMSAVVSGTKYRGEFEERFNNILYEISRKKDIIMFIDEFHTLTGMGSYEGSSDSAANMLKPALARGDIRLIGATTLKEYTKDISKDGAFARRLQTVIVNEPTIDEAKKMLKAVAYNYEKFHNCEISDEIIDETVRLAERYITNRKLPDKAISVIDETAARIKKDFGEEKPFKLTSYDIKETIHNITNIDISDIDADSRKTLNHLKETIENKLIGQNEAVDNVVKAIRRAKAGIKDPNKPIASFLFVGPTGVGKTELTKIIASELTGSTKNLIRFDMSEYTEKNSVSKLIGSPPGYVGFGDGGKLTEAVKNNPNSVILFDEIEKANEDIFNIFLQILDDGILTDSMGTTVDFKNSIIIMTSNAGYRGKENLKRVGFISSTEKTITDENETRESLESVFKPEFINRLDKVITFNKLSKEDCKKIAVIELNKIAERLKDKKIEIKFDESVVNFIVDTGYSNKYGARNIKRTIQEYVEDIIADGIIDQEVNDGDSIILVKNDTNDKVEIKKYETVGGRNNKPARKIVED